MRYLTTACVAFLFVSPDIARAQTGLYDALLQDDTRIAAQGGAAPGGGSFTLFSNVDTGDSGDVVFTATIAGGTASEGLFRVAGGVPSALALRGQAAPGATPGTYLNLGPVDVNDVGSVAFGAGVDHLVGPNT